MHSKYKRAPALSSEVLAAAIEAHKVMGPGLPESIYEKCLLLELQERGISVESQVIIPVSCKEHTFEESLRLDVLVESCLLVELKAIEGVLPIHKATVLSYMKLMDVPLGLILNFHRKTLEGIHRLILEGADRSA